jgi:hypothetical protein
MKIGEILEAVVKYSQIPDHCPNCKLEKNKFDYAALAEDFYCAGCGERIDIKEGEEIKELNYGLNIFPHATAFLNSLRCSECGSEMEEKQFDMSSAQDRAEGKIVFKHMLVCRHKECGATFVPDITMHRALTKVEIKVDLKLPEKNKKKSKDDI